MAKQQEKEDQPLVTNQMVETQEIRCAGCGRFLGFQAIVWGILKIKCTNSACKQWNTIDVRPDH